MKQRTQRDNVTPYVTKDGSEIRELLHPNQHAVRQQSLAEARVPAGAKTILHRHRLTEEIYHITSGSGIMSLGDESFPVQAGDSMVIPPGTPHCIANTGETTLVILCCCAPAYSHEDTILIEDQA